MFFVLAACTTPTGGERQPCYANGTCDLGLTCASGVCVSLPDVGLPDAGGLADAGPGGDAATGDDGATDIDSGSDAYVDLDAYAEDASTDDAAAMADSAADDAGLADAGLDAGECSATVLADETFETTGLGFHPTSWTDGCFGGSTYNWQVGATARNGAHGLTIDFRGTGAQAVVALPMFWPTTGTVTVSMDVRPETTNQNIYVLPVRASGRIFNAVPFDRFGHIGGDASHPYTAGTWYNIDYLLDMDAATWMMLADGSVVSGGPFVAGMPAPCTPGTAEFLGFHGGFTDQHFLAEIDNVTITSSACTPPSLDGWYVYSEPSPLAPAGSFSGALMQLQGSTLSEGPCAPACGGPCTPPYHSGCGHFDHVLVLTDPLTRTFATTETYDISITIDRMDPAHNLSGRTMSAGYPNTFTMQFLGTAPP